MEKLKTNLKNLYDIINKIAKEHKDKGEDFVDKWFLTTKEFQEIKKDSNNRII